MHLGLKKYNICRANGNNSLLAVSLISCMAKNGKRNIVSFCFKTIKGLKTDYMYFFISLSVAVNL